MGNYAAAAATVGDMMLRFDLPVWATALSLTKGTGEILLHVTTGQ